MVVKVKVLSRVWLFATPWPVAHQAPPSMAFSRQEYWSRLPFPSPENMVSFLLKINVLICTKQEIMRVYIQRRQFNYRKLWGEHPEERGDSASRLSLATLFLNDLNLKKGSLSLFSFNHLCLLLFYTIRLYRSHQTNSICLISTMNY